MHRKKTISEEIAILEENRIDIKIENIEGIVVFIGDLPSRIKHCWNMSKRMKKACMRSGLNYHYFAYPKGSLCCIFTELPVKYKLKFPNCLIVTVFESPEDFMASPLAYFYRSKKVGVGDTSNWDEFGYYTTNSYRYNMLPLVAATNKLVRNKVTKRQAPQPPPPGEPNGLFLFLFG